MPNPLENKQCDEKELCNGPPEKKQKLKRAVLSVLEKNKILLWIEEQTQTYKETPTRASVIEYVFVTFGVRVSRTFVTSLQKDRDKITIAATSTFDQNKKRMQPGNVKNLEEEPREWF